ncbi:hypothetical protein Tco_0577664 [Tanacetum coccineum]
MRGTSLSRECHPAEQKKFFKDVKHYFWVTPLLSKSVRSSDRRCVNDKEAPTYSKLDIMDPQEDLTVQISPPKKIRCPSCHHSDRGTFFAMYQFARSCLNMEHSSLSPPRITYKQVRQVEDRQRGFKKNFLEGQ